MMGQDTHAEARTLLAEEYEREDAYGAQQAAEEIRSGRSTATGTICALRAIQRAIELERQRVVSALRERAGELLPTFGALLIQAADRIEAGEHIPLSERVGV